MRLKSIEINGFKSFADKVHMDFEDNVTAIVGPNGSGKSNVSDAVRWVLGEQSAKMLRGSKMEDVIFSGTENKAQKNSAQVTITFDNSSGLIPVDFKEVSVSRKLYRTGESEYYLNKTNVRLKDIRELFLDTGIGKEGYSIISQGKIEEIVNGKAEDRRAIFDEASGIAKIKYKKIESERKLQKSKENLVRLKDIIIQNKERHSYLKVQSEKAKKAKILNESIEKLDFSQSYSRFNYLKERIEFFEKNLKENTEKLNLLIENKNKLDEELSPLNEEIQNISTSLEIQLQEQENTLRLNGEYKNKSDILQERNKNLVVNIESMEKSLEDVLKNIENLEAQILENDDIIASKKVDMKKILEDKNNLNVDLKNQRLKLQEVVEKIDVLNQFREEKSFEISNLEAEKKASELFNEQNLILKKKNDEELELLNSEKKDLELEFLNKKSEEENFNSRVINLNDLISDLENERSELKRDLDLSFSNLNKIKNELIYKKKEYELINNHIKNYDGYNKSIQDLARLAERDGNLKSLICGTLGDLIEVDEKYRKAIDTVLSSNLQGIVVEREEDAKFLIEKMKVNKISRINFFPITKIKSTKSENNIKDEDILSFANFTVKCNDKYREIVDYFLNKTIICADMDIAIKLSRKYKNKFRIVTLDGDIINTWGSISGGYKSTKNNFSILGRKEQLNKIKSDLDILENEIVETEKKIESLKVKITERDNRIELENNNFKALMDEVNSFKEEISKLELKREILLNDIEKISKFTGNESHFYHEKEDRLNSLKDELKGLNENFELLNSDRGKIELILIELEKKEYMLNNEIDISERDINLILNSKYSLLENKSSLESKISFNKNEVENFKNSLEENKLKIEEFLKAYEISLLKIEDLKKSIQEKKEKLKNYEDRLSDSNVKLNDFKINILTLEKDVESDTGKLESNKAEHQNIISRLCEEYFIDENQCEINMEKYKDEVGTKTELKKLKQDLKNIGSYSYDSIEEFEKVDSELTFQKAQEIDLNKAIADINSILKKLEKEMRTAFVKEFEIINRNFSEIFTKLFNGGEARLELDGEDILTSGIEIVARPYGKKMQSLSLMSGGEKSLTAIALLFAIFETRPSPFCLLDEIDASLDDSNILRYTNYLKNFLDEVQFIMITHRKPTMEMANMIYGVTMEKKGISKIVSMKFDS